MSDSVVQLCIRAAVALTVVEVTYFVCDQKFWSDIGVYTDTVSLRVFLASAIASVISEPVILLFYCVYTHRFHLYTLIRNAASRLLWQYWSYIIYKYWVYPNHQYLFYPGNITGFVDFKIALLLIGFETALEFPLYTWVVSPVLIGGVLDLYPSLYAGTA